MVFVVERYIPGLSHSELLRGLARLEGERERRGEGSHVRYLGSTVVLEDEACFCQFEGPTEAAVAEANQTAGLPFDRIVSAVNVRPERRTTMNVSATIPATVQIRRSRFLGLIAGVAAVAAATTWAVLTFGVNSGSGQGQVGAQQQPTEYSLPIPSMVVTRPTGRPEYLLPIPSMVVTQSSGGSPEYSLPIPSMVVTQPAGGPLVYSLPIPSMVVTQPAATPRESATPAGR